MSDDDKQNITLFLDAHQVKLKVDRDKEPIYREAAKRVNDATRCRIAQMEINSTPYPQFFGAAFSLYNDTNYMGNSGRNTDFVKIDHQLLELAEKG